MAIEKNKFSVYTYSYSLLSDEKSTHWSDGLKMRIQKDGVTINLESEEIEALVKSLPRTFGGTYR